MWTKRISEILVLITIICMNPSKIYDNAVHICFNDLSNHNIIESLRTTQGQTSSCKPDWCHTKGVNWQSWHLPDINVTPQRGNKQGDKYPCVTYTNVCVSEVTILLGRCAASLSWWVCNIYWTLVVWKWTNHISLSISYFFYSNTDPNMSIIKVIEVNMDKRLAIMRMVL